MMTSTLDASERLWSLGGQQGRFFQDEIGSQVHFHEQSRLWISPYHMLPWQQSIPVFLAILIHMGQRRNEHNNIYCCFANHKNIDRFHCLHGKRLQNSIQRGVRSCQHFQTSAVYPVSVQGHARLDLLQSLRRVPASQRKFLGMVFLAKYVYELPLRSRPKSSGPSNAQNAQLLAKSSTDSHSINAGFWKVMLLSIPSWYGKSDDSPQHVRHPRASQSIGQYSRAS